MIKLDKITEIKIKDGILTISQFDNNQVILTQDNLKKLLKAINYTHSCTELPNKAVKDSQLSDMVEGYKIMCKPDTNFEKYYSKGFTECWEWLKRITK